MKKKMVEQIVWEVGDPVKIDNSEPDYIAGMTGTLVQIDCYIDGKYRALVAIADGAYVTVDPRRFIETLTEN